MVEKRRYPRYDCKIKTKFEYYDGAPEDKDIDISVPNKGKGFIFDISHGGVFIVTSERVNVDQPIKLDFSTRKRRCRIDGRIIRIGLIKNNPSEVAQKFVQFTSKGDSYIACEFNDPIEDFTPEEL